MIGTEDVIIFKSGCGINKITTMKYYKHYLKLHSKFCDKCKKYKPEEYPITLDYDEMDYLNGLSISKRGNYNKFPSSTIKV